MRAIRDPHSVSLLQKLTAADKAYRYVHCGLKSTILDATAMFAHAARELNPAFLSMEW